MDNRGHFPRARMRSLKVLWTVHKNFDPEKFRKMDSLSPEEQARVDALGPPRDANVNIDWGADKVKLISRRTWTTKNPELRVNRARLDLLNGAYQGCDEEARLLTPTRLNTAWQKLDKKTRGELMAARSTSAAGAEPVAKKQRLRKKDGTKFRASFFRPLGFGVYVCSSPSQPMPTWSFLARWA
jgi:hypothetical protein